MPSIIAIIIGLIAGFIFLLITAPGAAIDGFLTILTGGAGNMRAMGQVLYRATPILMTGLGFAFANKTGLFNIGGAGQFLAGAYAAMVVGANVTFLPGGLHWAAAVAAAMVGGALWGAIPGLLKAFYNVNEVIACIMTNYIAMYLVNFLVPQTIPNSIIPSQSASIAATAVIPRMGLNNIFILGSNPSHVHGGIIIAVIMAVILYVLLQRTKFGYELRACGYNRDAARYAGINERRAIVMSMLIAGAMAGIGGAFVYLESITRFYNIENILPAQGFMGIPIALLAMSNPIGVVFSAVFVAYLVEGGLQMQRYNISPQIIDIMVAIIIYLSAFAMVFRNVLNSAGRRIKALFTKKGGAQ
jgi:simple sugar transport system permease protein